MRRHTLATLACLAYTVALSGCVYDAAKPIVFYENNYDATLVIKTEGGDGVIERTVESGTTNQFAFSSCVGTSIVVETEDGELFGRIDEPACPFWKLVINEDGTFDYQELDH